MNATTAEPFVTVKKAQPLRWASFRPAAPPALRTSCANSGGTLLGPPPDLQAALDESPKAAAFFATLSGANRYAILYRIGAVKRAEARARKIASFIAMLERHETVHG
jgi:hypothetical protein